MVLYMVHRLKYKIVIKKTKIKKTLNLKIFNLLLYFINLKKE